MTALEIAGSLSARARLLIAQMGDGEMVYPLADIARDAELTITSAKEAMAELKTLGITKTGPLFREADGKLCGSGTWLNRLGLEVRSLLKDNSDANG